ncbi:MAG: DUF4252 domain-containing protein [Bacteroidota bacterium]
MKKIVILFCAVLFVGNVSAQTNAISKHFKQFQRDTSFTKVSVTSRMFSLFTEIEADDEDEEEILAAMAKLKGIKALVKNDSDNARNLYFDALDVIQEDGGYEELMTVEDGTENIYFTIREEADKISELLMVIGGNKNFMVMTLFGEIDLNSIAKLSRVLKIKGMEAFEALDPDNASKKK